MTVAMVGMKIPFLEGHRFGLFRCPMSLEGIGVLGSGAISLLGVESRASTDISTMRGYDSGMLRYMELSQSLLDHVAFPLLDDHRVFRKQVEGMGVLGGVHSLRMDKGGSAVEGLRKGTQDLVGVVSGSRGLLGVLSGSLGVIVGPGDLVGVVVGSLHEIDSRRRQVGSVLVDCSCLASDS
jgi:hypothetical protein